jgi:hypothetical protein
MTVLPGLEIQLDMQKHEKIEKVTGVVCGGKAPKSICQEASPGFPRLRAIEPSVCGGPAKRFAQDDGSAGALRYSWIFRKHEKIEKVRGSQDDGFVGV